MPQPIARVGDTVSILCSKHGPQSGSFYQGTSNADDDDGDQWVLVGHCGNSTCGHIFQATAGSSISQVDGIDVVRVGDPVVFITGPSGSGTVATGSPISFSD